MAWESWSIGQGGRMRGIGTTISGRVKDLRNTRTTTPTLVSSKKVKLMGKGCTPGRMEKCMTGSGEWDWSMAMECGKEQQVTPISESGLRVKLTVMEFMSGRMETDMKENGSTAWNTDKEQISLPMVMFTWGTTRRGSLTEQGGTIGPTVVSMLEASRMGSSMVTGSGGDMRKDLRIHMRVNTRWTRNTGKESSIGQAGISMKEIMYLTREMGSERWLGPMAQLTRETGGEGSSMEKESWCSLMELRKEDSSRTTITKEKKLEVKVQSPRGIVSVRGVLEEGNLRGSTRMWTSSSTSGHLKMNRRD